MKDDRPLIWSRRDMSREELLEKYPMNDPKVSEKVRELAAELYEKALTKDAESLFLLSGPIIQSALSELLEAGRRAEKDLRYAGFRKTPDSLAAILSKWEPPK